MGGGRLWTRGRKTWQVWLALAACLAVMLPATASGSSDTYSVAVTADSPASYWRLNDSSGTTAADEQGANDGTAASVTWGQAGALLANLASSAQFSSASSSSIALAAPTTLMPNSGDLTVEAWVSLSTATTAVPLVTWDPTGYSGTVSRGSYQLLVDSSGRAVFKVVDNASLGVSVVGPTVDDGVFHHLVGVLDRTNSLLRLYVDGQQQATSSATGLAGVQASSPMRDMHLGMRFDYLGGNTYFSGYLDEVAIYLSALSANRVAEHYRIGQDALVVRSTANTGHGTLRRAIGIANALTGANTISFALTGASLYTIRLQAALPSITEKVAIDGTTQTGYAASPLVGLVGPPTTAPGLVFDGGSGSVVKGLAFDGFLGSPIVLNTGSDTTTVAACWIGLQPDGTSTGITGDGIVLANSDDNLIGGGSATARNVIVGCSGAGISCTGTTALGTTIAGNYIGLEAGGVTTRANGEGVLLAGGAYVVDANVISGNTNAGLHITTTTTVGNSVMANLIGTDPGGLNAKPNGTHGIHIEGADSNTIGGSDTQRNIIAGNSGDGVRISGASSGNTVASNYIGVDGDGLGALGNQNGIQITAGAQGNVIGGTTVAKRNLIGGNSGCGVLITGVAADTNLVQGNHIGLNVTAAATGNGSDGVRVSAGAVGNVVGGTTATAANTISNNGGAGVAILGSGSTGNAVEGNTITANTGLAIDLGGDGVTANDTGDADAGPNKLQNMPALDGAVTDGVATATVVGSLDSTTNASAYPVRIEFFEADTPADASGHGEALRLLGSASLTAPGAFTAALTTAPAIGKTVSAVAIDAGGNTSEMAANVICAGPAHHLSFVNAFANTTAGQAFNPVPTVDVCDSAGRRVWTATPQVSVAVTTPTSGAPLVGTTTLTAGQGRATFTGVRMNVAGTGRVVTATSTGLTSAVSPTFDIAAAAADAQHVTISASSSSVIANNSDLVTLTIVVKDQYDNPVAGVPASNLVVSGTPSTGLTIVQPATATDAAGRATATAKCSSVGSVTFGVALNATASPSTAAVSFVAGPVSASLSSISVDRTTIRADGSDYAVLTVTARDALGHAISGVAAASVVLSVVPAGQMTLTQPSAATDSAGQTTGRLSGTLARTVTVSAKISGVTVTTTVDVTLAATTVDAAQSGVTAQPGTVQADGASPVTLTVTLLDTSGNALTGVAPSRVAVSGSPNTGLTIDQPTVATNSSGQTTATVRGTAAGSVTFSASLDGAPLSITAAVSFTAGSPHAPSCTMAADKSSALADGSDTVHFTLTVADAHGNPVAGVSPSLLSVGPSGTGGLTIVQPTTPTDALGHTTASATSTVAQGVTFDLTVNSVATGSTTLVNFTAGAPDPTRCTLAADRSTAVADGADAVQFTATVADAQGNRLVGLAGTRLGLRVSSGAAGLTAFGATNGVGQATAQATTTQARSVQFTLTVDGTDAGSPVTVDYVAGPLDQGHSALVADRASAVADGADAIGLTLTLRDAHDNPLTGVALGGLVLAADGPHPEAVAFVPVSSTTNAAGQAALTATGTRPQAARLTATLSGASWSTDVTFTPRAADPAHCQVTLAPAAIAADGADRSLVTVVLADGNGTPVEGIAAADRALSVDSSSATVTDTSEVTGQGGQFTAGVTSAAPGDITVTVRVHGSVVGSAVVHAQSYQDVTVPAGVSFMGLPLTPYAGGLGGLDGVQGLAAVRWDAAAQAYGGSPSADYRPGEGLWLRTATPVTRRLLGAATPLAEQRLALGQGWNACANPFGQPLAWDLAAIGVEVNGTLVGHLSDQALWTTTVQPYGWAYDATLGYRLVFDPTRLGFEAALGELPPGCGVWLRALTDGVSLVLPPPVAGGVPRARRATSARDWALTLSATQGSTDRQNLLVGMTSDLARPLELAQPPEARSAPGLTASLLSANGTRLAGALGTAGSLQSWDLDLCAGSRDDVVLAWPALGRSLPSGLLLELLDPATGSVTLLNTRASWHWQPSRAGETRRLRLTARLGHVARSSITNLTLAGSRAAGHTLSVTLSAGAEVTLTVRGLGGRLVKQVRQTCAAGTTALAWDGTDADGRPVPRGVYQLEAQATSANGALDKAVRTVTVGQ